MSITLQRAQATSILKYIVGVGEGSSKLITLSIFIPFFLYMLLATSEGFGTQSVPLPLYDSLWVKVFFGSDFDPLSLLFFPQTMSLLGAFSYGVC